jgi:hypothetical protein
MSSKSAPPAVRRPNVDDLVAIARAAGRDRTTSRTIHRWVGLDLVDRPLRLGRNPRYPLRAVGQVDTVARLSIRAHGVDMVRFALFIETDSVPAGDALRVAAKRADAWQESIAVAREQAAHSREALRAEIEAAARLRVGNSVLPREVRMSLTTAALALSPGGAPGDHRTPRLARPLATPERVAG